MHQENIPAKKKKAINQLLNEAGFESPTPFQKRIFSVFFRKKDIVAYTNGATGKRSSFIVPLLVELNTHKNGTRAIIIVSEKEDITKVKREFSRYITKTGSNIYITGLVSDSITKREDKKLSANPDIIIGTPKKIIDHIRCGNINVRNILSVVVYTPANRKKDEFYQDISFIFSKMPSKRHNLFFTDKLDNVSFIEPMVKRPIIISMEDFLQENNKMQDVETQVKQEEIEKNIKEFINTILTEENPDVLNVYKKLFKQHTPFSKRGYLSAYLLKEACNGSFNQRRTRKRVSDPNKTTLFVSIGKNKKIYPKDLARFFQSRLDLAPTDIGAIKILDNFSFLDISKFHAKRAIEKLNGEEFKGKKLVVNFAKKRDN